MSLEVYGTALASGGLAFLAGLTAGYFIKRMLKLVAAVLGFIVIVLAYLTYENIIAINWAELQSTSHELASRLAFMISYTMGYRQADISVSIIAGAAAGFAAGMLKG